MNEIKIAILGSGAYGLAMAKILRKNNCQIKIWSKLPEEIVELENDRTSKRLPGIIIEEDIIFSTDMGYTVKEANLILIAIPVSHIDSVLAELSKHHQPNQHICIASKGIERDSYLFTHEILAKHIKTDNVAVISGPSFAIDLVSNHPIGLSLGVISESTEKLLLKVLQNDSLKLRVTDDIVGIEICGSIKNVMAIATGILNGLSATESTQAMFITESLHDIRSLIKALGGNEDTALSFAGLGDLLLTCTSTKSRNFSYGRLLGQGKSKEEIDNYLEKTTVEGVHTLESIYDLISHKGINMPIINLIYDIAFNSRKPQDLFEFLINKE